MNRIEELRQKIRETQSELVELKRADTLKEAKQLEGKYFKYLNGFGGGTASEKWWMYTQIKGVTEDTNISYLEFQQDLYGSVTVRNDSVSPPSLFTLSSYIEITADEFDKARADLLEKLQSILG